MTGSDGVVHGMPGVLLRLEGAVLGYLANPRLGAALYNAAHVTVGPAAPGVVGLTLAPAAVPIALIRAAHIGFDRAVGYGLKYPDRFQHTHLGADLGTRSDPG